MDIATLAAEWWLKWAFGLVAAGLAAGYRHLQKKQKEQEAKQKEQEIRQKALEKGMQAILRDRILVSYYKYQGRECITLHGLENVENMYKSYHDLGGNGTVTHLMEAMREMKVVDDKCDFQRKL